MLAKYLGRKVPYTGKACVMELLTPEGSGAAKFSKCARDHVYHALLVAVQRLAMLSHDK